MHTQNKFVYPTTFIKRFIVYQSLDRAHIDIFISESVWKMRTEKGRRKIEEAKPRWNPKHVQNPKIGLYYPSLG